MITIECNIIIQTVYKAFHVICKQNPEKAHVTDLYCVVLNGHRQKHVFFVYTANWHMMYLTEQCICV